ncbi:aquaporin-12-like [Ambystoma mexicanum]|uniref:aquaporin-12-like n=1 Tax=Ambystoma mexicanum TaxID=8296 RepID=UPI0037E750D6
MAGLNISIAFFVSIVVICEVCRRLSKMFLPSSLYQSLLKEAAASLQLAACCMELRMLVEIGPWGGGFGPDVVLTLLFLLFLAHGASFDGASGNPCVSLQEFLTREASCLSTLGKLVAQYAGMEAAKLLTNRYWSWELTDFHLLQNLMARDCSSPLRAPVSQGMFAEAVCAFFFHATLLRFQHSRAMFRVPAMALMVSLLAYTAGPYTAAFFNPTLAWALTFHCSGATLRENVLVYCLGPIVGMAAALLLYHGNIPRLFQRNLLYNQKSKCRTPKLKGAHFKQNETKANQALQKGQAKRKEEPGPKAE